MTLDRHAALKFLSGELSADEAARTRRRARDRRDPRGSAPGRRIPVKNRDLTSINRGTILKGSGV